MTATELAAIVYALATAVVVGFQVALAAGAPWGEYAMGGRFPGRFPPAMRAGALVQAVVLALLALVVAGRGRLRGARLDDGAALAGVGAGPGLGDQRVRQCDLAQPTRAAALGPGGAGAPRLEPVVALSA